jgi:hypothetical protein
VKELTIAGIRRIARRIIDEQGGVHVADLDAVVKAVAAEVIKTWSIAKF